VSVLITVDPGRTTGVAIFRNTILLEAGYVHTDILRDATRVFFKMVEAMKPDAGVVEIPRVYPSIAKWKGDPNDLISVALVAGMATSAMHPYCDVELVTPHAWKGNRPKEIDIKYTESLLLPVERQVLERVGLTKSKMHNVLDAVGIGLWKLKRR
jgi:hypothetical protein